MKKLTFTLNTTWIAAVLLCTLSVQGMETSLPKELIIKIANYCAIENEYYDDIYHQRNKLMHVCKSLNTALKRCAYEWQPNLLSVYDEKNNGNLSFLFKIALYSAK